jgi:8-oxo-dGTP pyrophosphatase MutT (NUDIX family)
MIACIREKLLPAGDTIEMFAQGREAAVLMPFRVQPDDSVTLVFTKRHDDLSSHPGQISFPGGSHDPGDADLIATALRESYEELAIPVDSVEVIGGLEPMATFVSDFAVFPVAGLIPHDLEMTPNPGEVETVFEVDIAELMAIRERRELRRNGMTFTTEAFETHGGLIWGVTGYILAQLLDRVGSCIPAAA